ncbi:cupin domain-containing protein [Calditerrivibrio nitroreducens]|uniref:Transcriptional regulator, MerR family n=1 Tax=Calditerrivibrio nitroreducens (strain DSM 19672 / NBRC 101217 / Yu37-1) TaxID=768670 RepID=E4TII2_CALNY|nr:cupin domain-containing protein [Calditerrivibrio nitroreducens]ADR19030.1 transcriptional regulator, MerR family [Calditerrivibrio nitroreducens DSM 19672]
MGYGEKIRDIRKRLGMTLEDVSLKTGFTKSFISQIENGKNSPSIASLKKICYAIGISISELFEDERNIVFKFEKDDYKVLKNKNIDIIFMASKYANRKIEPLILEFEPHSETGSDFYHHTGEEFGYVLEGVLTVVIGNDEYTLQPGESIYFSSNLPHKIKNRTDKKAKAFWVGTPPSF